MPADPNAARRAQLQAEYGDRLTPAQIDAVLADEALFRQMGGVVSAALQDNGELPFVPLFAEQQ
jgi:hypothetical protein